MADHPVVERFIGYLREHNLPVTAQRLAIAEVLLTADRHLSAEEIAEEVSARGRKVGTATVYRAIDTLLESGLITERDFGEGFRRFEPTRDVPNHEHLVCTQCGKVEEFRDERLERMTTIVAESRGFARQRHRLVIHGICSGCQRGGARPSASTPWGRQ
ncbi:MAG: transcriptional repressor [Gemmatimonadaceae bacterium]|nr:transcriptional repressor [Gemmatimonadaceae bacterium]